MPVLENARKVHAENRRIGLPRRDYFILPLLCLSTIALLSVIAEIACRYLFVAQELDSCLVWDPVSRGRFKANCTSITKSAEGPLVKNEYNECGYRSPFACGAKAPGTLRIVLLGSSFSQGDFIRYDDSFPAHAARQLSQSCGRKVEFQNLGVQGASPDDVALRAGEVISLHPDVVLYPITPFDVEQSLQGNDSTPAKKAIPGRRPQESFYAYIKRVSLDSRALFAARHYLLKDRQLFVRLYLAYGDKADFLRRPLTPAWNARFGALDKAVHTMTREFSAANIPLMLAAAPSRAEAGLLDYADKPVNVDPHLFGERIAAIARQNNAGYIDLVTPFSKLPRPDLLFYPIDGHLKAEGQPIIAQTIVDALLNGSVPAFANCLAERAGS